MSHFKAVIFDLDGTLLDTIYDLSSSCNRILSKHQFNTHDLETYRKAVGDGPKVLIERILPIEEQGNTELICQLLKEHIADYNLNCTCETKRYEGMEETLKTLVNEGILLIVFTNKQEEIAHKIITNYFKDISFLSIIGYSNKYQRKPDPGALLAVLERYQIHPIDCLYVGDSEVDVETSRRGKIPMVAVDYGFRTHQELINAGANIIVSHPQEILGYCK